MSLSDEWTEWHLTNTGWFRGSSQRDFGVITKKESPKNTVLTCRFREKIYGFQAYHGKSTRYVEMAYDQEEKLKDPIVQDLLKKYGNCPEEL